MFVISALFWDFFSDVMKHKFLFVFFFPDYPDGDMDDEELMYRIYQVCDVIFFAAKKKKEKTSATHKGN